MIFRPVELFQINEQFSAHFLMKVLKAKLRKANWQMACYSHRLAIRLENCIANFSWNIEKL